MEVLKSMMRKKVMNLITKPSTIEGWAKYSDVLAEGVSGALIGGGIGYAWDLIQAYGAVAENEGKEGSLTVRTLSTFGGSHALATRLSKNVIYQLRGGKRFHMDDALVHGLSGASLTTVILPGLFPNFATGFLVFAAAEAFLPLT